MDQPRIRPIGHVRSPLQARADAPRQGDEGAPDATIVLDQDVAAGLDGIAVGDELLVLTWLHEGRRDVLRLHPRGDQTLPLAGVFATRSPDRPNPIGLHPVTVRAVGPGELRVGPLEAIDGTPVLDLKPVLHAQRPGFHAVTARLVVADAAAQVGFLRAVFDAAGEEQADRPAEMRIGDSVVLVSQAGARDAFPAFLYVYVSDADAVYRRALAAGAVSLEQPLDTPYRDRRAMVRDPFGNVWQIAHVLA